MDDIPVFDPIFRTQSPVHCLLSQRLAKHGRHSASANLTPPVIHLHDTLPVSQALLADAPRTHYNMPCSEIHRTWPSHAARHASIDRIMHYSTGHQKKFCEGRCSPKHTTHLHQKKFCEGRCSPKHTTHLYKSKTIWLAGNFHAAAPNRTLPKSPCRSSRQTSCLRLRAWIDLNSLDKLNLQHSNSALLHSEAQNTPQFLEGCC